MNRDLKILNTILDKVLSYEPRRKRKKPKARKKSIRGKRQKL